MYEKKRVTVNTGGTPLDDSALEKVAGGWGGKIVKCPYCEIRFFLNDPTYPGHLETHTKKGDKKLY